MKKVGIVLVTILFFLFVSCVHNENYENQESSGSEQQKSQPAISSEKPIGYEKEPSTDNQTPEVNDSQNDILPAAVITELGISVGAYIFDIVPAEGERYKYDISLSSDNGNSWQNDKVKITSRPVPYYADNDYFILKVDADPEEMDSLGYYGNCAFLVYTKAEKSFTRLISKDYEVYSFRVFDGSVYCGVHEIESNHGYISILDIATGEVRYYHETDEGRGPSLIEAWAPQVQLNSANELRVWLHENDNYNYIIEGDILVPAEQERSQPFFSNDTIPVDF